VSYSLIISRVKGIKKINAADSSTGGYASSTGERRHEEESVKPVIKTQESMLVTSVDLSFNFNIMRLCFKTGRDKKSLPLARLTMKAESLQSWLDILFSQWDKASWPTDIWPVSMQKEPSTVHSKMSTTVH
jgi:hypothetical protein